MTYVILLSLICTVSAAPTFTAFIQKYGKVYTLQERILRRAIYAANVAKIEAHNAKGLSWSMGVNAFADLTGDEFKARYASGFRPSPKGPSPKVNLALLRGVNLPASVDWEAAGAVTAVKNQGQCGADWAFSTTGSVEGLTFIKTGKLIPLSEQQLVDCAPPPGSRGCGGGLQPLLSYAFQYIIDNKGIASEASYPYTGRDGTCRQVASVASITGVVDVPANSDVAMMTAIAQQPVSVFVEADQNSFQFYTSGVMTSACGTALDHVVLAVGYGTQGGQDYYKVKNCWGVSWGEQGYILLGRGAQYNGGAGQCGMLSYGVYPTQ